MQQILDRKTEAARPVFLRLAFRPLFFSAAVLSALAMLLWSLNLRGIGFFSTSAFSPYGGALFWHGHEMLFGFAAAVVVGFLLTAVQNWTGIPGVRGAPLALLFGSWLVPRLLLAFPLGLPPWLILALDLLFLPLAAFLLARPLVAVRQTRNLFFVPVLLLMAVANGLSHWGSQIGLYSSAWLIVLLMTVLGGRVIPMFTANGTGTAKALPVPLLERAVIAGTVVLVLLHGAGLARFLPADVNAVLLLAVGGAHLARWLRWRTWITLRVPLLWSLHAAYAFIPLGLLLLAASYRVDSLSYSTALHALMAGAMGNMILSMMARVSLGHTGRMLQPPRIMNLAFLSVLVAGLMRSLGVWMFPQHTGLLLILSGGAWILAYGLFPVIYWPVLSRPRVDGQAG